MARQLATWSGHSPQPRPEQGAQQRCWLPGRSPWLHSLQPGAGTPAGEVQWADDGSGGGEECGQHGKGHSVCFHTNDPAEVMELSLRQFYGQEIQYTHGLNEGHMSSAEQAQSDQLQLKNMNKQWG